MEQQAVNAITSLVTNVGFPIALVLMGAFALWKIGKPAAEALAAKHMELMDSLAENLHEMKLLHASQAAILDRVERRLATIEERLLIEREKK
jgi:hypothetical protein